MPPQTRRGGEGQLVTEHLYYQEEKTVTDGNPVNVDCRGFAFISINSGAGATTTHSRVKDEDASAEGFDPQAVTAGSFVDVPIRWGWYRISPVGGDCTYFLVP